MGVWGDCFIEPRYCIIGLGRTQGPLDNPVMDSSSTWTNRVIGKFDWELGPITHDIMHETYVFDKLVDRKEARA